MLLFPGVVRQAVAAAAAAAGAGAAEKWRRADGRTDGQRETDGRTVRWRRRQTGQAKVS